MISPDAEFRGHGYTMGNVNAYCLKCSDEETEREGRFITVLDCVHDDES